MALILPLSKYLVESRYGENGRNGCRSFKAELQGWLKVGSISLSRAYHAMRDPVEAAFGSNWSDPARRFRFPQALQQTP